jgi:fumarylpyruvate hydrolase
MSSDFVIAAPAQPALPVVGTQALFPVRRIYCVGRNYAEHAREMGHDAEREPPFFFAKPASALVPGGADVPYPPNTQMLHHEAELVVALGPCPSPSPGQGADGRKIPVEKALDHVWGYACGNDLTRRDLQSKAKSMGRPWDMAKGFAHSAVIGPVHPVAQVGHLSSGQIDLSVNGSQRQAGDLADMIWSVPEVVSYLSGFVALAPGDLIMTGTPAGVGPLSPGDTCRITISGLAPLESRITAHGD